ncbi:ABC transporter permease, partial [Streptomyces sp. NRRL WC-3753]
STIGIMALPVALLMTGGEFDLSVGAIVTAGVVVAAQLYASFPALHWLVATLVLLAAGGAAGLVSGLVTTRLRVPSFITTLGMMLILEGAVFFWTGGSPQGAL